MRIHANILEHVEELNRHHYVEYVDINERDDRIVVITCLGDGEFDITDFAKP